jgi:hypothetical protein
MKSSQHNLSFLRKILIVLPAAAMFSGCAVVFESPLARSLKTKQDERLFGRWMGRDEEGNPTYIQCERSLRGESSISFFVEKPKPSYLYLDYRNPIFRMTTTKIGNRDYMILRYQDASKGRGHQLARYMVEGDKLTIWIMNADKVKEATKTGQIRGEVGVDMLQGVTITDSWRKIAALLKSSKSDEFFVRLGEVEKVAAK